MEVAIEIRKLLVALFLSIIEKPTVVSGATSCISTFGTYASVVRCRFPSDSCCLSSGVSRCCRSKRCTSRWDIQTCSSYSSSSCCPLPSYGSTCCDRWQYRSYTSSSSRSYWSSRRSSSSSSKSYWSSWSKSWEDKKQAQKKRTGILVGAMVGGICFVIFAIVIPVVICSRSAERSSTSAGGVIGTAEPGGPQITGAIPAPLVSTYPQYAPAAGQRQAYNQGGQYPPANPGYQSASAPPPPPTDATAPPPSYDAAMALLAENRQKET